jgi:hypothetical protein
MRAMDWINLAEDRKNRQVVNTGSTKCRTLLNDELLAYKEGPCSME